MSWRRRPSPPDNSSAEGSDEPKARRSREPPPAKLTAMRLLARREHSEAQLRRKLEARGIDAEEATQISRQMADGGWLDDRRYAALVVRSRTTQGFGPRRIRAELSQAGVAAEAVEAAFEDEGSEWTLALETLWQRKFGQPPKDRHERDRQLRYLLARGFDTSTVYGLFRRIREDAPDDPPDSGFDD